MDPTMLIELRYPGYTDRTGQPSLDWNDIALYVDCDGLRVYSVVSYVHNIVKEYTHVFIAYAGSTYADCGCFMAGADEENCTAETVAYERTRYPNNRRVDHNTVCRRHLLSNIIDVLQWSRRVRIFRIRSSGGPPIVGGQAFYNQPFE